MGTEVRSPGATRGRRGSAYEHLHSDDTCRHMHTSVHLLIEEPERRATVVHHVVLKAT